MRMPRFALGCVLTLGIALGAGVAQADPHDPQESGHPLRIAAYVIHPAGVILDTLVFQPTHWLVHRHRALEALFGHTG